MDQPPLDPATMLAELAKELRQRLVDLQKIVSSNTQEVTELRKRSKQLQVEVRQLEQEEARKQPTQSGWSSVVPSNGTTAAWKAVGVAGFVVGSAFGLLKSGTTSLATGLAVRMEHKKGRDQVERIYELARQYKIADPTCARMAPGTEIGGLINRILEKEKAVNASEETLRQAREHAQQLEAKKERLRATIRYKMGGIMPPDVATAAKDAVGTVGFSLSSIGSLLGPGTQKSAEECNAQPKPASQHQPRNNKTSQVADSCSKPPTVSTCNICNVQLSSKQARAQHMGSRDHKTKVDAILASCLMMDVVVNKCTVCDLVVRSDEGKVLHVTGKTHTKHVVQSGGDKAELRRLLPHRNF